MKPIDIFLKYLPMSIDSKINLSLVLPVNWKINIFFFVCFVLHATSAMAIPIQNDGSVQFSLEIGKPTTESLITEDVIRKPNTITTDIFEQSEKNISYIAPDVIGWYSAEAKLNNLNNSKHHKNRKKRGKEKLYTYGNKSLNQLSGINLFDTQKTGSPLLFEFLTNDPELKENENDVLEPIKGVKELFIINKETSYISSEQDNEQLIKRNLYLQIEKEALFQKGINRQVSKKKYDSSIFSEFFSKVLMFLLYTLIGIISIKLVFMYIVWQRKRNRY